MNLQTGFIYHYAFLIFIGFLFFLLIITLPLDFFLNYLVDFRIILVFVFIFFIYILN
jgi:hypothetical protein